MHADLLLLFWNPSQDDSPMKVTCICKQAQLIVLLRMTERDCVSHNLLDAAESSVMVGHPGDSMYLRDP